MTMLAWVFPENANGPIFNYGTNYYGVHFWVADNKLFSRFVTRAGITTPFLRGSTLNLNAWNFVGMSYDNETGDQKHWVEGKVYDVQNIGTFELNTQAAVRMGVLTGNNRVFKGRISCMQVYDKALTEKEVHAVRGLCFQKGLFRSISI